MQQIHHTFHKMYIMKQSEKKTELEKELRDFFDLNSSSLARNDRGKRKFAETAQQTNKNITL